MDHVSYISDTSIYEIVKVKEYVQADEDVEDVMYLIEGTNIEAYKINMYKSIDQGYAFRIYEDGVKKGFIYSYKEDGKYLGGSILLKGAIPMALGLKHVFDICDWHKIQFLPHGDTAQFKSMLTGTSLRVHNSLGGYVSILRKDVAEAGYKIFRYFNLQHGWCSLWEQ